MHHNPFATRFTATGKIPFLPPCEIDLRVVCDDFIAANFVGQICGPHGSGKTTMALAIEGLLQPHFASTRHFVIRKKSSFIFSGVEVKATNGVEVKGNERRRGKGNERCRSRGSDGCRRF